MIQKLSISNFKSVRELDMSCRRVNVFIGEPNAGKTNILEALGLWCGDSWEELRAACRIDRLVDLFFDQNPENPFEVTCNNFRVEGDVGFKNEGLELSFSHCDDPFAKPPRIRVEFGNDPNSHPRVFASDEEIEWGFAPRYYLFGHGSSEGEFEAQALNPPFGNNLAALLLASKEVRQTASAFFSGSRYRLTVERAKNSVMLAREEEGTLVALPYEASSETLRRMIFHHLAIDTNHSSSLVFDEPEAHAYPPYTKILAEKMAKDDRGNQFFLTTHSPYMLTSLIEKTPVDELNVVLCRMENFETKAYVMSDEQKGKLLEWGMSAFYNFDRLVDDEP